MLKTVRTILTLCLAALLAASCGGNVMAPDYSNLTTENHPRVMYTDADFAAISQAVAEGTNPYLAFSSVDFSA